MKHLRYICIAVPVSISASVGSNWYFSAGRGAAVALTSKVTTCFVGAAALSVAGVLRAHTSSPRVVSRVFIAVLNPGS
jgi:hypothetical protein